MVPMEQSSTGSELRLKWLGTEPHKLYDSMIQSELHKLYDSMIQILIQYLLMTF